MGYGSYCSIADLKGVLGITSTTDDTIMRKIVEASSRSIDKYTNRCFYITSETRYFDGHVPLRIDDNLSITTLKTDEDGDATFENTLTEDTDFQMYPLNKFPRTKAVMMVNSSYGSFGISMKGCQIAGTWGYGDGISATPYVSDTTTTESVDISETAIDVTAVTNLSPGQVILIESEQMYIYSISTLTLTVQRAVNGTTAVAHEPAGDTIYIYQYPADIRQACIDLSVALYQNRAKHGIQSERLGDYSYTISKEVLYGILEDSIRSYRKLTI